MNRKDFIKAGFLAAGSRERVHMGFIGLGNVVENINGLETENVSH